MHLCSEAWWELACGTAEVWWKPSAFSSSVLLGLVSVSLLSTQPHIYSMGFGSDEPAGQSGSAIPVTSSCGTVGRCSSPAGKGNQHPHEACQQTEAWSSSKVFLGRDGMKHSGPTPADDTTARLSSQDSFPSLWLERFPEKVWITYPDISLSDRKQRALPRYANCWRHWI